MKDINAVAIEVVMNAGDGRMKIDEALAAMAAMELDKAGIRHCQQSAFWLMVLWPLPQWQLLC